MRTIHKQQLKIKDQQIIEVPEGAKLLTIGVQEDKICIWYECEAELPKEERIIYCFGTGYELPRYDMRYINTISLWNGSLIYHFYEKL